MAYRVYSRHNEFPYHITQHAEGNERVKQVVFKHFCSVSQMVVEIAVHWTNAWEYMMAKAPGYHTVCAVVTEGGRTVYAKTYSPSSVSDAEWAARPKVLQGAHSINALCSERPLLSLVGGQAYCYSKRDQKALDAFRAAQED